MQSLLIQKPKALIGLGNPGARFDDTRHNIGFMILDQFVEAHNASWSTKDTMLVASIPFEERTLWCIKPQTFMNDSGKVIPWLLKKGITAGEILVIHDELELSFGKAKLRMGGSARGHNGLRSIIDVIGKDFPRLSFGIGRPTDGTVIGDYVLQRFTQTSIELITAANQAVTLLETIL
ncbi:MAG: aminoacyl-tRNA hydrolase [Candidatus Babeliales bacterium]